MVTRFVEEMLIVSGQKEEEEEEAEVIPAAEPVACIREMERRAGGRKIG